MDLSDIARSLGQVEGKVDALRDEVGDYHGEVVNMSTSINTIERRCLKRGWLCKGLISGVSGLFVAGCAWVKTKCGG